MGTGALKQIGRHEIKHWLGSGATADVFLAFDPEIRRTLAIKSLKKKHSADADYVARFMQESKAAGVLSHPNIVTIYDVGQADDKPYIVMEFVDGEPLDGIIAQNGAFSLNATLSIGAQIADALNYAHSVGVVHRDIKPSNLMLLKDNVTIKITDFGIARRETGDDLEKTRAGTMLGTPQYMSPEQVLGLPLDGRSDLFSLGSVLYLMATGEKPFQADTVGQVMSAITHSHPRPIREIDPDFPQGLQSIIMKLLAREPGDRYQSGAALKADLLDELQALEGFEQTADQRSPRSIRNKLTASMAALAATVTILFGLYLHDRQSEVFTGLAIDSGASMTKLAASEIAEALIVGDTGRMEITVNSITQERSFVYLDVGDREGVIIASNMPDRVGQLMDEPVLFEPGDTNVKVVEAADREYRKLFKFTAPVNYADTRVGTISLGLSGNALESALTNSLIMLFIIALITTALVSWSAWYLIGVVSNPLLKVQAALKELSRGGLTERISHKRKDQVGELYDAFNTLAEQIIAIRPQESPGAAAHDRKAANDEEIEPSFVPVAPFMENADDTVFAPAARHVPPVTDRRAANSPMREIATDEEGEAPEEASDDTAVAKTPEQSAEHPDDRTGVKPGDKTGVKTDVETAAKSAEGKSKDKKPASSKPASKKPASEAAQ